MKLKNKNPLLFQNKKAGERVLSIYLFIIYIIVAIGIVSGVIIFHGTSLDVREKEAGILSDKVIDCLVEQGQLKKEILNTDIDLISFCNFNFKDNTEKYKGEERYAVKVEIIDFETNNVEKTLSIAGNSEFLEFCNEKGDKIPKCNEKKLYVLDGQNKFILRIVSAVGKVENV